MKAFGREQIFYGVSRIVANAGTRQRLRDHRRGRAGRASLLNGDGGDDVVIHDGRGGGTINGGNERRLHRDRRRRSARSRSTAAPATTTSCTSGIVGATLNGGDGNDRVVGGPGADTINGGDDNDLLEGGGGDDAISGGDGDDTIRMGMPTGISARHDRRRRRHRHDRADRRPATATSLMVTDPAGATVDARFSTLNGTNETGAKQAAAVETLAIDLGRGADRVTIGPMTESTIRSVRVDTGRTIVNTGQVTVEFENGVPVRVVPVFSNTPDNAADVVTILGGGARTRSSSAAAATCRSPTAAARPSRSSTPAAARATR